MKKVSIIIPAYNASKYLHKCLDSVVNQTIDDYEVIIVNDGSTDDTFDIIKSYQEKYPNIIKAFTKENGGQATARNLALTYAEGEYIGYIDADDFADVSMFGKMYDTAKETNADMVACSHFEILDGIKTYKQFKHYLTNREMCIDCLVSPWNKLIKHSLLTECEASFPNGYIYEDTAWFMEIMPYLKKFEYIDEPLLYHVIQKNSTMTSKQGQRTENIFNVLEELFDFYKKRGLLSDYHDEIEFFFARILFLSSMVRISKIEDNELRSRLVKKSFDFLNEYFPNYKKNKYLSGKRGAIIKYLSKTNAFLYCQIIKRKK